jgi:putative nucleotidyltransferase with HDIG domain
MTEADSNTAQENRQILLSFAKSIEERDIATYEHSRRVATYVHRLARYLGWSRRDARNLALAALVHDLGKTWIANDILHKSESLSNEELRTMERHPVIGARILIGCEVHPFIVETVLYHHEVWDGRGYPTGLSGEEIPLSARILTVADVYDILISQYPNDYPHTKEIVCERLLLGSAIIFDPTIVQAFVRLLETEPSLASSQDIYNQPMRINHRLPLHHFPFSIGI